MWGVTLVVMVWQELVLLCVNCVFKVLLKVVVQWICYLLLNYFVCRVTTIQSFFHFAASLPAD